MYDNEISKLKNRGLFSFYDENNELVIKYYSTSKKLLAMLGNNVMDPKYNGVGQDNNGVQVGACEMWDVTFYEDREIDFHIDAEHYWYISQLRDYENFNDKTSSIKVWNNLDPNQTYSAPYLVTPQYVKGSELSIALYAWENDNMRGALKVFYVQTYQKSYSWPKLRDQHFNDKITSIKLQIQETKLLPPPILSVK